MNEATTMVILSNVEIHHMLNTREPATLDLDHHLHHCKVVGEYAIETPVSFVHLF